MRKRTVLWIVSASIPAVLGTGLFVAWGKVAVDFDAAVAVNRLPHIRPDHGDAVIPPNIAPLNFLVEEPGTEYGVRIRSAQGAAIDIVSRTPRIEIPLRRWRQLLRANRGRKLYFDVCVHRADGQWARFEPIVNTIADAEIDKYLFYRLMRPIYIMFTTIDICQRDVTSYEESIVLNSQSIRGGCINCHSFAPNHPERMILQIRDADRWSGMVAVGEGGKVTTVDTREQIGNAESERGRVKEAQAAYTAWHPDGRVAAFSANRISQFFHAVGDSRDVFDAESDLALYHADSNTVTTTPNISKPDRLETFPAWSPDGHYLYFCSTDPLPVERHQEARYDLMRIRYEADSGRWGEVEPMLLAEDTGLSITEPRVSPDGRWLLFCMSAYGAFPAYQSSSDLYLLNLETRQHHRLAVNSPRCDSWHSWSSNSRWIAFASKRIDGLFARIYLSYVDEAGHAHKPVLLPQKDPTFYDRCIKTYNVPELARWPAPARGRSIAKAIRAVGRSGAADVESMSGGGMQESGNP